MSLEYSMGYCPTCDSDKKLERKKTNHVLHFLISIVLGTFTNGIGSAIWIVVWFLISTKVNNWTCHTCENINVEPHSQHSEIQSKKMNFNILGIIKKSYKIIIVLIIIIGATVFLYPLFQESNTSNNNKENSKSKDNEEKIINATVDIKEKEKRESTLDLESVKSDLCYIYDTIREPGLLRGTVSCKEGKITIRFYNSDINREVITKTVDFKDNKFLVEVEGLESKDFTSEIKLTKKQIEEHLESIKKEKSKNITSIEFDEVDNTKRDECILEKWAYSKFSEEYLLIVGQSNCILGQIVLDIYDNKSTHLGKESAYINNGVFKVYLKNSSNPTDLNIDYKITQ